MARRLLMVLLAIGAAACASQPPDTAGVLQAGAQYVAMGSSYAAGAGIGPLQPGSPPRCQRTTNNYASLLAQRHNLRLTDASCGGAKTAHLLGAWDELPPQLDALTAGTRLVTVTIGGNDLDYMGALFGGSCRAGVVSRPGPCPPRTPPDAAQYARLETALASIAHEVSLRSPQARLVFVQYLSTLPEKPCAATAIAAEDAADARAISRQLAAITARVAAATGALLVEADILSRDHTACGEEPWSHGLHRGYDASQGAPWHPAPAGHAAIARELERILMR